METFYGLMVQGFSDGAPSPVGPVGETVARWAMLTDPEVARCEPWKDGEAEIFVGRFGAAWRFRAWHHDSSRRGLAWQVDVLAVAGTRPQVVVTLRSATVPTPSSPTVDRRPIRVSDLGAALVCDPRLASRDAGWPVRHDPVVDVSESDLMAFAGSPHRRLHLCVVSSAGPDGRSAETLADELAGNAHVVLDDGDHRPDRCRVWAPGLDRSAVEHVWPDPALGALVRRRALADGLGRDAADLVAAFDDDHRVSLTEPR